MEQWTKFLDLLRQLPLWIFLALTAAGLAVLYMPVIPGLSMTAARGWPWLAPATVLAGFFLVCRSGAGIIGALAKQRVTRLQPVLRFTFNSQVNTTWYSHNRQADGSTTTQICADLNAFNPSGGGVRLVSVRLIRPHLSPDLFSTPLMLILDPMLDAVGGVRAVRPHANAGVRLNLFPRRTLGKPGKFLTVVFGLTDQRGYEYRVKVRLWPLPEAVAAAGQSQQ